LRVYPDSVHFIVDVIRYESHGRLRKGVCSTFLAERCNDQPVPVFPSVAKHFHLPEGDVDIIMVGPGTGIAPFRAFLQERRAVGARGRNWLFFGAQHEKYDYSYGDEFEELEKQKFLTHLHLAFSRDKEHKVYVQHRMQENAAELWRWLDAGAYFYVCGDALKMAKDVDAALRTIVQEQSGKSPEEAQAYVEQMKVDKRYKRDVY
jgi:sulfite reductase (NADPH) flavoprotein alpha-component